MPRDWEPDEEFGADGDDDRDAPLESDVVDDDEPGEVACPNCRQLISELAEQCPRCGEWVSPGESAAGGAGRWIGWAVAALLAALALTWVLR